MIYSLSLETVTLIVGLLLIVVSALAYLQPAKVQNGLRAFPRSSAAGTALLLIAGVWAWLLVTNIDLGEFTKFRFHLQVLVPVSVFLTWHFVDELLAARALGMVALLAAEPLLEAAWMRPEQSRLILVTLAYVWIVFGMFWIGMPYLLRDQIAWLNRTAARWSVAAGIVFVWGAALAITSLTLRR